MYLNHFKNTSLYSGHTKEEKEKCTPARSTLYGNNHSEKRNEV